MRRRVSLFYFLFTLVLMVPAQSWAIAYRFTPIENDDPQSGLALIQGFADINDSGQVLAISRGGFPVVIEDNVARRVPVPGTPTASVGFNNAGQVAGSAGVLIEGTGSRRSRGYLWDTNSLTIFNVPGADSTDFADINDRGQIIGTYDDTNFVSHAFLKDGDNIVGIDIPGVRTTIPLFINDLGDIVGLTREGPPGTIERGFRRRGDQIEQFDLIGGASGFLTGFNDAGQIVGGGRRGGGDSAPYILDLDDGTLTDFEFPVAEFPGVQSFFLAGINNEGELLVSYRIRRDEPFFRARALIASPITDSVPEPGTLSLPFWRLADPRSLQAQASPRPWHLAQGHHLRAPEPRGASGAVSRLFAALSPAQSQSHKARDS
jgi:probable HAF family extracellular repeat protein